MVVAYNGVAYHGWQRQAPPFVSVQQLVEEVAGRIVAHRVIVAGAGRTDAGVHAQGQVANFYTTNFSVPLEGFRRAMNSRLPHDIAVVSVQEVPNGFNSSRSAIGKTYRYRILVAPQRDVQRHHLVYHYWRPLEADLMRQGALRLLGKHDFRGLATSSEKRASTVRTIFRCDVSEHDDEIHVTVQGDGFLYNMVRNIVGTLIDIGRQRFTPEQIDRIIATGDRALCGPTVPPQGLSLMCVHYAPGALGDQS